MNKSFNDAELSAHEAQRDLAAELLQSVKEMRAGQVRVVSSPVVELRQKTGLSQMRTHDQVIEQLMQRAGVREEVERIEGKLAQSAAKAHTASPRLRLDCKNSSDSPAHAGPLGAGIGQKRFE